MIIGTWVCVYGSEYFRATLFQSLLLHIMRTTLIIVIDKLVLSVYSVKIPYYLSLVTLSIMLPLLCFCHLLASFSLLNIMLERGCTVTRNNFSIKAAQIQIQFSTLLTGCFRQLKTSYLQVKINFAHCSYIDDTLALKAQSVTSSCMSGGKAFQSLTYACLRVLQMTSI